MATSTETAPAEGTEVPETEGTEAPPQPGTDWEAEAEKWKTLARQHESRSKANAEAAQRIQEMEESQKSETEKLQDKVTKADARADKAEAENVRLRVALAKGLTLDIANRLQGDTEEELLEDADQLLAMLHPNGAEGEEEEEEVEEPTRTTTTTPKPKFKSGTAGGNTSLGDDPLTRDLKRKLGIK